MRSVAFRVQLDDLLFENEGCIRSAIVRLPGSMTKVVMTHRLSAVRGDDVIHVLEERRLVESGDWDTLLGKEERFASPARAQGID